MTDELPTVWPADRHTLAKHKILEGYLAAWMPIMTNQFGRVRYIDAFAGAGEYSGGEPGSPVVVLNVALRREKPFRSPVVPTFIEQDKDRHEHLTGVLEQLRPQVEESPNITWQDPVRGDAEQELRRMLGQRGFSPALVFLDQFGYAQVSMELIGAIMRGRSCEVFSFMNWRDMNRWMRDPDKSAGITRAFGGGEWKAALELPSSKMQSELLAIYERSLETKAGVRYRCRFDMRDKNDKLLYWLFFCSGNLRGLEEMKRAMWKVDDTGQFHFSDRHAGQPWLLKGFDQDWLAGALLDDLDGQELAVAAVKEHVLVKTPCYLFNNALRKLEKQGKAEIVSAPAERKRGSFAKYVENPSVRVRFGSR